MPFSIELILSEWANVRVSLMITFVVDTFKSIETWFSLFHLQSGWVNFEVHLTAPGEMSVIFTLV